MYGTQEVDNADHLSKVIKKRS